MSKRDLSINKKVSSVKISQKSIDEFKSKIESVHKPKWYLSTFAIVVASLLFILPGLILIFIAKEQKRKIERALSSNIWGLYRSHFEDNYKNIEFLGPTASTGDPRDLSDCVSKMPANVPLDARSTLYSGVAYKIYDKKISFNTVQWTWTRSNGKTTTTYTYYYLICTGREIDDTYSKFQLRISKKGLFSRTDDHKLGSQAFNKKFAYKSSDPMLLRKVMQPSTQALFIDYWDKGKHVGLKTPEFYLKSGKFIAISNETKTKYRPFILNFTLGGTIDSTVSSVIKDIETDIEATEHFLLNIASLKKLFK